MCPAQVPVTVGVHVQGEVEMGQVFVAALVVAFAILSLFDPKLYRKLFAPLSWMKEDDLPLFPRAAAFALLLFFGFVVLAPAALRMAGTDIRIPQPLLDWMVVVAFLIVGLGLAIIPRACIQILKWPQPQGSLSVVVVRIVGIFLMIGSALFTKSEILRR